LDHTRTYSGKKKIMTKEVSMKLIDFWAPWCQPCKMMDPILDEIQEEFPNLEIERVNVDEDIDYARDFNVTSVPTYILKDSEGKEVKRVAGAMPKYRFLKEIGLTNDN
jgi:thioredoxin 1